MLIETFYYSDLTVSFVKFDPGDEHFIAPVDPDAPKCLGVLFLSGSWELNSTGTASEADDMGFHVPNQDGTWPRGFWNDYGPDDYCKAGPGGVKWICAEENDTGPCTVTLATAPLMLPAGTGLLVASGSVTIGDDAPAPIQTVTKEIVHDHKVFRLYRNPIELDGGTGGLLSYFKSKPVDRDVIGSGQILLVTR